MVEGFGNDGEFFIEQRGFGDENVLAGGETIDDGEKMGTQETFGAVAFDRISDFFPGDKPHTPERRIFAEKKDKSGGVPRGVGTAIDRIKFPRSAEAVEVF
jgi:hypothetical protein